MIVLRSNGNPLGQSGLSNDHRSHFGSRYYIEACSALSHFSGEFDFRLNHFSEFWPGVGHVWWGDSSGVGAVCGEAWEMITQGSQDKLRRNMKKGSKKFGEMQILCPL